MRAFSPGSLTEPACPRYAYAAARSPEYAHWRMAISDRRLLSCSIGQLARRSYEELRWSRPFTTETTGIHGGRGIRTPPKPREPCRSVVKSLWQGGPASEMR